MPQMAPMLWLILFFYFIILFMLFISNFYFTSMPSVSKCSIDSVGGVRAVNWMW